MNEATYVGNRLQARTCQGCSGTGTVREYFGDSFGSFAFGPCGRCKGRGRLAPPRKRGPGEELR